LLIFRNWRPLFSGKISLEKIFYGRKFINNKRNFEDSTQQLAYIFGDPLLLETGLEGGHLESAISVMSKLIVSALLPKFPQEVKTLSAIREKLEGCRNYCLLIKNTTEPDAKAILPVISKDIAELKPTDFLILPGGWRTVNSGHAMLYIVELKDAIHRTYSLTIVNSGAGSFYHFKIPTPNEIKINYLKITDIKQTKLINSIALSGLLELQITNSDSYGAHYIYEIILPMLEGKVELVPIPKDSELSLQLAGTCFWQCLPMGLRYFFLQKPNLYQQMKLTWEYWLLAKLGSLYDQVTLAEIRPLKLETNLRLASFACRSFSKNILDFPYFPDSELFSIYSLLTRIQKKIAEFTAQLHASYCCPDTPFFIEDNAWRFLENVDLGNASEKTASLPPFIIQPSYELNPRELINISSSLVEFGKKINFHQEAQSIRMDTAIKNFLYKLPIPSSEDGKAFWQKGILNNQYEAIALNLQQLMRFYFQAQFNFLNPNNPRLTPVEYASRLIPILTAFCCTDFMLRNYPGAGFINKYHIPVVSLFKRIKLFDLAPEFTFEAPRAACQFLAILNYLKKVDDLSPLFDFYNLKLSISDDDQQPEVDVLIQVLKATNAMVKFRQHFLKQEKHVSCATAILDNDHQWLPPIIHAWRALGLLSRFFLTSLTKTDFSLLNNPFTLILSNYPEQKISQISLNLPNTINNLEAKFYLFAPCGLDNYLSDRAIRWLVDTPTIEFNQNKWLTADIPEPSTLHRDLFNQLAGVRTSHQLQILSAISTFTDNLNYLESKELVILLRKTFFQLGYHLEKGCLLMRELQCNQKFRPILKAFFYEIYVHFSGQKQKILSYLSLIDFVMDVDSFVLPDQKNVIIEQKDLFAYFLYGKLQPLLDKDLDEATKMAIHASLILLFRSYSLLQTKIEVDVDICSKMLEQWANINSLRNSGVKLQPALLKRVIEVIATLEFKIIQVLSQPQANDILNHILKIFISSDVPNQPTWQRNGQNLFVKENFTMNVFEGCVYYNNRPLAHIPSEIMKHPDYCSLYGAQQLAVILDKETKNNKQFKAIGIPKRHITLDKNSTGYSFALRNSNPINTATKNTYQAIQKFWQELPSDLRQRLPVDFEHCCIDMNGYKIFFSHQDQYYRIDFSTGYPLIFQQRYYAGSYSEILVYCHNAERAYFTLQDFEVSRHKKGGTYAVHRKFLNPNSTTDNDLVIHEEMEFGNAKFWAQYLPTWRLIGILPEALIGGFQHWLHCSSAVNDGFMDNAKLTANNHCIYIVTPQKQYRYLFEFKNQKKILSRFDDYGQVNAHFIDLLRCKPDSLLLDRFSNLLYRVETPSFVLGWNKEGKTIIELPRLKLEFLFADQHLYCQQFSGYELIDTEMVDANILPGFTHYLCFQNEQNELLLLVPHVSFLGNPHLEDDPLSSVIAFDYATINNPKYFTYVVSEDLKQLQAQSPAGKLFLVILYFALKEYQLSWIYMQQCYQDSSFSTEQWLLLKRFFKEFAKDQHPDAHACRIKYTTIFLDYFLLLDERFKVNDLNEIEQQQLEGFKKIINDLADDYGLYLRKWKLVNTVLRLTDEAEKQWLQAFKKWSKELPCLLHNRLCCLQNPNADISLTIPAIAPIADLKQAFQANVELKNFDPSQEFWFCRGSYPTLLGLQFGRPVSMMDCFLSLYQKLRQRTISVEQGILQLRCIVATERILLPRVQFLLDILLKIIRGGVANFPDLPITLKNDAYYTFSKNDSGPESKRFFQWLAQVISIARISSLTNNYGCFPELATFTQNQLVLNPAKLQFNTLNSTSVGNRLGNQTISFSVENIIAHNSWSKPLFFEPLRQLFTEYFVVSAAKPDSLPFPLAPRHQVSSSFEKMIDSAKSIKELLQHFAQDYSAYLSTQISKYHGLNDNEQLKKFNLSLNEYKNFLLRKLDEQKNKILGLANKNPVNDTFDGKIISDESVSGLTIRFMQIAQQQLPLNLFRVIALFARNDRAEYFSLNPFLTEENFQELIHCTILYLLCASTIKRIKFIFSLLNNISDQRDFIIQQIATECAAIRHYSIAEQPNYLIFEYQTGFMLWEDQVQILRNMKNVEKSQAEQLIMGKGKTTVIAPLLGEQVTANNRLMVYTVPGPLMPMFRDILSSRFNQIVRKQVHSFNINRATQLNTEIVRLNLTKIQKLRDEHDLLTITPEVPNCLLLKWLEITHSIYYSSGNNARKEMLPILEDLLCEFLKYGSQLLEETDWLLSPFKSELNFTIGAQVPLGAGGLRWTTPQFLLKILFEDKKIASLLEKGLHDKHLKLSPAKNKFSFPKIELTNLKFYNQELKRALINVIFDSISADSYLTSHQALFFIYLMEDISILADDNKIMLRKLELVPLLSTNITVNQNFQEKQQKLIKLVQENCKLTTVNGVEYFMLNNEDMYSSTIQPVIVELCDNLVIQYQKSSSLGCERIILLKEWLVKFLPHILVNKIFRVHYGPYFEMQHENGTYVERRFLERKLAVPYFSKDNPNIRAEFQHPDIIIGFTCLQYYYEGLTLEEFTGLLQLLQNDYEQEKTVAADERTAAKLFKEWLIDCGLPYHNIVQIDTQDKKSVQQLYDILHNAARVVTYYINRCVFPVFLKLYPLKITSNAQDLAALIFKTTKGFSGTTHNYLSFPHPLECNFQKCSDGQMLYLLGNPTNNKVSILTYNNNLDILRKLNSKSSLMFIDSGALITGLSNFDVAKYLLNFSSSSIQGVLFVNDAGHLAVLKRDFSVVASNECGILPRYLIKYIDHAHTTGSDVPQNITDQGVLTLGMGMNLRDYFQGAKRLRKLGNGQTIETWLPEHLSQQVREINNLDFTEPITSIHVMRWLFFNTSHYLIQEIYTAAIHKFHWVVRRRAFFLLMGILDREALQQLRLTTQLETTLWEYLHDEKYLDRFNRVINETKSLPNVDVILKLPVSVRSQLQNMLNVCYQCRIKKPNFNAIKLCFDVFTEVLDFSLNQALPLDVLQNTRGVLERYIKNNILGKFDSLLLEPDRKLLNSIKEQACDLLPNKTKSSSYYMINANKEVECQVTAQAMVQKHTEQIKEQQKEQHQHQYTFFKPYQDVIWDLSLLVKQSVKSLIVPYDAICQNPANGLRLCTISEVFKFRFDDHILATENFLRTESDVKDMSNFSKRIVYFLEIQNNDHSDSVWILLSIAEADHAKTALTERPNCPIPMGLRNIAGKLIVYSQPFADKPIKPEILVQMKFLNGDQDGEYPPTLKDILLKWKHHCGEAEANAMSKRITTGLRRN
jgi:hypothetical protein